MPRLGDFSAKALHGVGATRKLPTFSTPNYTNNSTATLSTVNGLAVSTSGIFVSVGQGGPRGSAGTYLVVSSSSDGTTWTSPTTATNATTFSLPTIGFSTVSNLFSVLGRSANPTDGIQVTTSTNGVVWSTPKFFGTGSGYLMSLVLQNANSNPGMVAVGNTGSGAIFYPIYANSTDGGINWNRPVVMSTNTASGNISILGAASKPQGGVMVCVGFEATNTYPMAITSSDGITWNAPILMNGTSTRGYMYSVAINTAGIMVAVGWQVTTNLPLYATSSDNGVTWTIGVMNNSVTAARMYCVTVNSSGLFVATGADGSNNGIYAVSTNGTNWTTPTLMGTGFSLSNNGNASNLVAVNNSGLFVAIGQSSSVSFTFVQGNAYSLF
jgi:hypothetical protein